jgi:cation diffusion facilitator family transporter
MSNDIQLNIRFQKLITVVAIALFLIKMLAWYVTNSVAILTDALESIVNIVSAFVGLYSLSLSAKPKDENHPYGHGKIEFVSASIEGLLIVAAGLFMIYEAVNAFRFPKMIDRLDYGIILIAFTAIINYLMGYWSVKQGKERHSPALMASGEHLKSDTFTTIGIIVGLVLMYFTQINWLDGAVALIFAVVIIHTGVKVMRSALAGILDEADDRLLKKVVKLLENNRNENWIDVHNLRIIKYGSILHFDCHLTVPWYFNVNEAHEEVHRLEELIRENFGYTAEMFIHLDGCMDFSCQICDKQNCDKRQKTFKNKNVWTGENVRINSRHQL